MKSQEELTGSNASGKGAAFPDQPPYIHRTKKEREFTQIDNRMLNDRQLSGLARGIMAYILSKPNDWEVCQIDLKKAGLAACRS